MGFLGSLAASLSLFFTGDLIASFSNSGPAIYTLPNCNFDSYNYTYLLSTTPISVLPPKPTLHNSEQIYDSVNRDDAYNPATYYTFQTILNPLNTLNILLTTNSSCNTYKQNIMRTWATNKALTGPVNPYSTLLQKQTVATIATEYMAMSMRVPVVYNWFSSLEKHVIRYPSPYNNNFKIFEYRAIILLKYATFQNIRPFGTNLDNFVKQYISNGIITTEIRGDLTMKYHSYYLNYLFDTYYVLRYGSGYRNTIRREIESVLTTMQSGPAAFSQYSSNIVPENLNILYVLLDKWQCVYYNNMCRVYTGLWRKLSARRRL